MLVTRFLQLGGYQFRIAALALWMIMPSFLLQAKEAQPPVETLARVRESGTLRLGYYTDARPFSYQDEAGKPAGYAVALCQEIANDIKTELSLPSLAVEFVQVTVDDRYESLQQGKIDLLCGPSVETLDRRKEISFSIPIFPGGLGAIMRKDAPAQVRDAIAGREQPYHPLWRASLAMGLQKRTFSAVRGTTTMNWLAGKLDEFNLDAKIVPVESHDAGVQHVLDRKSDVLFGERSVLLDAKQRSPSGKDLMVSDRLFTYEPLALALARDDDALRLLVDRSLSRLSQSGQIQTLYKRYFGEPDESTLTFFRITAVPE